ncbi:nitroreductase [Pandoraea horticolens]|uniref:Nitroreductase n=1 Tax=Pandoraea horticolens TaxID=2508298 RepID=A0A5E4Y5U6_9BURK|nr:SagB family peptide dehydrogenase [Pandoraea horticolens]VVE43934.1 nitroreductase [Pandoraea horticolens]
MTPSVFLRIIDGKLVLWNYVTHDQYEIDIPHLERIIQLSNGSVADGSDIDKTIVASGCLDRSDPAAWGWDCLSRIFHIGTQIGLRPGETMPEGDAYRGYIEYCASIAHKIPELKVERPGKVVALPSPDLSALGDTTLRQALNERQTCRSFDAVDLPLNEVSTALWATFGTVHGETRKDLEAQGLMPIGYRRTSPSGGGLHPSEAYLVAMRVGGLSPGIYHYRSHRHELSVIQDGFSPDELGSLLCAQTFANDLSYGVFVTCRFDKMWWKYPHSRAYRVALLDIGCLTQTFQLVCAARGIQSWPTGYFIDHKINELLGVDADRESVMFFLGAGKGKGAVAREALSVLRELAGEGA